MGRFAAGKPLRASLAGASESIPAAVSTERATPQKSTNGFSPSGCGDPSQRPQSLWLRGVARGPTVLAWRFACPAVASHPLRLHATASMRFNQRFPKSLRGFTLPPRSYLPPDFPCLTGVLVRERRLSELGIRLKEQRFSRNLPTALKAETASATPPSQVSGAGTHGRRRCPGN